MRLIERGLNGFNRLKSIFLYDYNCSILGPIINRPTFDNLNTWKAHLRLLADDPPSISFLSYGQEF
jgi:hypothetical protein